MENKLLSSLITTQIEMGEKQKIITISLPEYLYNDLKKYVKTGKRSEFVTEAIKGNILDLKLKKKIKDPIDNLFTPEGRILTSDQVVKLVRNLRDEE